MLRFMALVLLLAGSASARKLSYKPAVGYVPDEETAIAIAIAVWSPIYGRKKIETDRPFHATLKKGVWTVTGTLPKGVTSGAPEAEISKDDGRILRVVRLR